MMARLSKRIKSENVANEEEKATTTTVLARSDTVLEMTRWKEERDDQTSSLVEIDIGQDDQDNIDHENDPLLESDVLLDDEPTSSETKNRSVSSVRPPPQEAVSVDVNAYMARREMTDLQERWNALTMIPSPLYCIYYILAGKWLSNNRGSEDVTAAQSWLVMTDKGQYGDLLVDEPSSCIHSSWFPHLHAMPPLTVLFVALGICLHAPFSMVYHWRFAPTLPPGLARTDHLSRRLDQAMIHVASACIAYATTASWQYFVANVLYNGDCFRKHLFQKEIYPRRNQIRIGISMFFYTVPILLRGNMTLFLECWAIIAVSVWLFVRYPFAGWSHSAFHLVIALLPPLVMEAACQISTSDIAKAAACAAMKAASNSNDHFSE